MYDFHYYYFAALRNFLPFTCTNFISIHQLLVVVKYMNDKRRESISMNFYKGRANEIFRRGANADINKIKNFARHVFRGSYIFHLAIGKIDERMKGWKLARSMGVI